MKEYTIPVLVTFLLLSNLMVYLRREETEELRSEAVKHGAAEWVPDLKTKRLHFQWKEQK